MWTRDVAIDYRRLHSSRTVTLNPTEFCKGEPFQLLPKILYHIITLKFSMNQNIQTNLLLPINRLSNGLTDFQIILLLVNACFFELGTQCTNLSSLRE